VIALIALLASGPFDVELSGGPAFLFVDAPVAPVIAGRVAADPLPWLSVGVSGLAVLGPDTALTTCLPDCIGNDAFRAFGGYLSLRGHTNGDWRGYLDVDIGGGELVSALPNSQYENAAWHGHGGPSFRVAVGGQWGSEQGAFVGAGLSVTFWSNVSRPGFNYGIDYIAPATDRIVGAALLLLSFGWASR
jgi:hypothetical protein